MATIPNLIPRRQWRAKRPTCRTDQPASAVRFLVVHYSAMLADAQDDHAKCAARVLAIQHFHMTSDQLAPGGACDIGYTWLVCRHGYVFRGRGWGTRQGATNEANRFSVAVCFLGGDRAGHKDVTDPARRAIRSLRDFCVAHAPHFEGVKGHRDYTQTRCPGDELYAFVQVLNRELQA